MLTTALLLLLPQGPTEVPVSRPLPFGRQTLSTRFFCEGAGIGDLDGDGDNDVVAGPYWYEGPEFTVKHALYPEKQFSKLNYSDNFFAWVHDLDGDGDQDVFGVGFPGEDAFWFENTGDKDRWPRHTVFTGVDNESPIFVDVDGDGRPDLVCQNQDRMGWLQAGKDPRQPWTFRTTFNKGAGPKFTHGLGAGDVNGDGRVDILNKSGWLEQPTKLDGDPEWKFHPVAFSPAYGGAQMLVYDVDGDGRNDVVSSYAAHGYGLAWFQQQEGGAFITHEVLPTTRVPGNVSELHALCLCDLDGDGLLDVVTGKRWWSHGPGKAAGQEDRNDPACLLGLLLRRDAKGARFEIAVLDEESGVGTQVAAGDVNGDGRADVVVANKRGTFVLRQGDGKTPVQQDPVKAQPDLTFETGTLRGWTSVGAAFDGQPVRGDLVKARRSNMSSGHIGEYWIGGYELLGDDATGTLTSAPFAVTKPWATFLVSGGGSDATRVEILDEGDNVLCSAHGDEDERLQQVLVDLTAQVGKMIRIKLIDEATGHWGHLNFDEFVFHDEAVRGNVADQVTGKTPLEAVAAMTTLPGFHVDLIAAEPDLHQPVALWVDERSRLWVAEAYSYPGKVGEERAHDTLLVFEDRDGDGSYEKRTVFYDKLDLVSGFAVGHGGVWVGAAPQLFFIPDADRDLVPDGPPEVVLDGFGLQDTHETLNSFIWGPDGWLYGTHGVFTHSNVGAPGTPEEQRVPLNAGVWRLHPKDRTFEVFAYGTSNPWGVDFDDRGQAFLACCVIDHLWHMVPGSRSQRQGGSHFDPHPWLELRTIADHKHYAGKTSDHAWWNGRNRPVMDPATDAAGGGHAHCGTLIYKGDAFGAGFRNAVLFANIHGNRINHDQLVRKGSGYVGKHAPDLLRANDPWFRGVALRQGANGEVFCIDWYDKNACHRSNPTIWDRTNGRLYRLRHGDLRSTTVALDGLDDNELAQLAASRNDFVVGHARRLLAERGKVATEAVTTLRTLLHRGDDVLANLHALWALHATGELGAADLTALLQHASEDLRGWAVRLACERATRFPTVIAALPALATREPSPATRLELASALQRLTGEPRWLLAAALLAHGEDEADQNLPTLLWYGVEPLANQDPDRFLQLTHDAKVPTVRRLMWRRAALAEEPTRAALMTWLERDTAQRAEILGAMVEAQRERPDLTAPAGWSKLGNTLLNTADANVRDRAADVALAFGDGTLAPVFRERLADPRTPTKKRLAALEALVRLRDEPTGPLLAKLLDDTAVRRAALAGLASYEIPEATTGILAVLPQLEPTDREIALNTLAGRPASARAFLDAVLAEKVSKELLDAASLRRQLQALGDDEVEQLLQRAWGRSTPPSETAAAEIARHKQLLTPEFLATADPSAGRAIFARTCQACHMLYGVGGVIGPDLTGSNRRDLDYLLANIVEPSAEVGKDYQMVSVRLRDGRLLTGNIVKETKTTLTLKTLAGTSTLRRDELAADTEAQPAIEYSKMSLMPPGQLLMLQKEQTRDLIAYLQGDHQAPLDASPENLGSFFDGETLSGWQADPAIWRVEDGELIGHSAAGLQHNNFAISELRLADFRLQVEVKLAPDTANSGIQFRSEPAEGGEMRGYQADIGKGWWGLLYEEGGRAVLSKAAVAAEKPGEWNTYEILAVGGRVQLALNGQRTVDLTDPAGSKRGVIGLQVHSGGPTEVRFRNFKLELNPEPVLRTAR